MTAMVAITGNTFPVKEALKAMGGRWDGAAKAWMVPAGRAEDARALVPAERSRAAKSVGEMDGLLKLFEKTKGKLKRPAIVIGIPGTDNKSVRLSIAGPKAKVPGSLTLTSGEATGVNEWGGKSRDWYGRVRVDGTFEPTREGAALEPALSRTLRALATDPAATAAEYGRLTGKCCFCNRALEDERSTAVGYGRVCAGHYGLPWGGERHTFKAEAA
jgi:hypothetical protein